MKLLIVDDQLSSQSKLIDLIQTNSELQNSNIWIANDGFEAISVAEKHDLDIILMDIQMPVMNGISATQIIVDKFNHVKVIMISSSDDKVLVEESINAGAKGYLLKENIFKNLIPAIQNINDGYTIFPKHSLTIVDSSLNSKTIIQPNKMDEILKINKSFALEILNVWIDNAKVYDSVEDSYTQIFKIKSDRPQELINFILQGDSPKCNLSQELELRFNYLISNRFTNNVKSNRISLQRELDIVIEQLDCWFYGEQDNYASPCFKSRLEANAQNLRIKCLKNLKEYFKRIFFTTSPMPCLEHLESIEMLLKDKVVNYQNEFNKHSEHLKSISQAYSVLTEIID